MSVPGIHNNKSSFQIRILIIAAFFFVFGCPIVILLLGLAKISGIFHCPDFGSILLFGVMLGGICSIPGVFLATIIRKIVSRDNMLLWFILGMGYASIIVGISLLGIYLTIVTLIGPPL